MVPPPFRLPLFLFIMVTAVSLSESFTSSPCPEVPASDYPTLFPLRDMLTPWPVTVASPPSVYPQSLCRFDAKTQLSTALAYRKAEVPFVLYNVEGMEQTIFRFANDSQLAQDLDTGELLRGDISRDFRFIYSHSRWAWPAGYDPPSRERRLSFAEWRAAAYKKDIDLKEPHLYMRVKASERSWLNEALPFFAPRALMPELDVPSVVMGSVSGQAGLGDDGGPSNTEPGVVGGVDEEWCGGGGGGESCPEVCGQADCMDMDVHGVPSDSIPLTPGGVTPTTATTTAPSTTRTTTTAHPSVSTSGGVLDATPTVASTSAVAVDDAQVSYADVFLEDAQEASAWEAELRTLPPHVRASAQPPWGGRGGHECRFGMAGNIQAPHWDQFRNALALVRGSKRYVLLPPSQCPLLYTFPRGHPSFRHSSVDWPSFFSPTAAASHQQEGEEEEGVNGSFPLLERAVGTQVVLEAGEVLYLPSVWLHYIISLTANIQCNTRAGSSHTEADDLRVCDYSNPQYQQLGGHR